MMSKVPSGKSCGGALRPLLLCVIASGLVAGCGCSETGIEGQPDAIDIVSPDTEEDVSVDQGIDSLIDTMLELIEDTAEDEVTPPLGCGNGILEEWEECDDGDLEDCNGCSAECKSERAMHVEGGTIGATVEATNVPCMPMPYTMEMWFRLDPEMEGTSCMLHQGPSCMYSIFGYGWDWSIRYENNCHMGTEGTLDEDFSRNTWHHFATTYYHDPIEDMDCLNEFMDGRLISGGCGWPPFPIPCEGPVNLVTLDSESGRPTSCFIYLDEFRISSAVLYAIDATFLPDSRLVVRPDTIALWNFNNEVDGVIPDVSGNGHDAVLVNGTLVPDDCHMP